MSMHLIWSVQSTVHKAAITQKRLQGSEVIKQFDMTNTAHYLDLKSNVESFCLCNFSLATLFPRTRLTVWEAGMDVTDSDGSIDIACLKTLNTNAKVWFFFFSFLTPETNYTILLM